MYIMKKEMILSIIFFILIIGISNFSIAIGLVPSKISLSVQPNNNYIINYYVTGAGDFDVEIGCDPLLEQYIEVSETSTTERGEKTFQLRFDFPTEIEKQGHEKISIIVKEKPAHEKMKGNIVGLTSVEGRINIDIPYKGLYAEMFTKIFNANKGEEAEFDVTIKNFGEKDIKKAYVKIEIYKDAQKIKTLKSEKVSIPIDYSHEFVMYLTTDDLKPGIYNAHITGYYDSKKRETDSVFKIGTLDILITNFTKQFYVNETNEFFIQIESLWNNPIERIFAEITISKNGKIIKEFKTPNYDLKQWGSQKIIAYWDTRNLELGEYDIEIKLYFADKYKTVKDEIFIVKRPEPEKPFELFGLNTTALVLIGTIIIMVIMNIIILISLFKSKNNKKLKKKKIKTKIKKQ